MRCYKWFSIALLLLIAMSGYARRSSYRYGTTSTMHYFGVSATGGYSKFFVESSDIKTYGQPSVSAGINYELIHKSLLFRTGLEAQMLQCKSDYQQPLSFAYPITDTQGKACTMKYYISDFHELDRLVFMDIPLMIGYSHPKGFFIAGGVRLGFCAYSSAKANLTYSTVGLYDQYIEEFTGMPNHNYFMDSKADLSQSLQSKFMTNAVLEVGYDVLSASKSNTHNSHCHRLELSLFAEVGLNSPYASSGSSVALVEPLPEDASKLRINSIFGTRQNQSSHIWPINAGLRISYFFKISDLKNCTCNR